MTPRIPIAKPWIGDEEEIAVQRPLKSGWVTQGPEVEAFENEFAAYVGAEYACCVSNCTTALFLALKVMGVGRDDEVITVSHSYIATANAIRHVDAIPVFIDIDSKTYNMNPDLIEQAITPKTKAILAVHQIGMPCDIETLVTLGEKHNLPVIEDAACAAGSQVKWRGEWENIGKPHGDIACFSFHPRKIITTGDGGMITSKSKEIDNVLRLMRTQSMSLSDTMRHTSETALTETYETLGYNFRMTDLQAAVGREQLKRMPEIIQKRRALANRYAQSLSKVPGVQPPTESEHVRSNWQSYCVRLPQSVDQQQFRDDMLKLGIATKKGVMCAHLEGAYQKEPWRKGSDLSQGEKAHAECVFLPLYTQMTSEEQSQVIEAFLSCIQKVAVNS